MKHQRNDKLGKFLRHIYSILKFMKFCNYGYLKAYVYFGNS